MPVTPATAASPPASVAARAKAAAVKACFEAKMAAAVTPEEIQGMNDFDQAVMSKVILAVSENARACKAEVVG